MVDRSFVQHLFWKKELKQPLIARNKLKLIEGYGIEQDVNSDRHTPREVLVVNSQDLDKLSISPGELRENIVLQGIDSATFKPGAKLTFAVGAEIRLTFYCEPCKRITHLVDSLTSIEQKRGILGVVVKDGEIAIGDPVKIEPDYFPALSEIPYERFLVLIDRIPFGKVITYKQILTSIGVDRSYYRVMPIYLKKAPENYPIHRILDSQGRTLSHIADHQAKLAAEGIKILTNPQSHRSFVSLEDSAWQNPSIC